MRTATFTFVETHERTVLLMVLRPFSHRSLCLDSLCPLSVCEAPRVQKRNSNAENETGFVHRRDECKNHRITRIYNTFVICSPYQATRQEIQSYISLASF